ncbi:MAG TPA: TonB family protein [Acidobacteriota bacterium]|nr:TonB family protein [Acidobacteriota bacterium]
MFDYAISKNQRHKPTSRIMASCVISSAAHILLIVIFIQFPELLQGGMFHRFRIFSLITEGLTPKANDDEKSWRTVTVLRPNSKMESPSPEQLKKLVYDWGKKRPLKENPPIRIRWGDEQKAALNTPPPPKIKQEPKAPIPPPTRESAGATPAPTADSQASGGKAAENVSGSPMAVRVEPPASKKETISLPPPGPPPKSETAVDNAPRSVPEGVKQPSEKYKVFDDEQQAIRSSESGFFGTKGFPLGEYANLIKERIKGKWNIPSNLQKFQGHTTVIFYIDKNGRYGNARIVASSGSNSFDIAALMAVIESDPFPPLPKGFPGNHIGAKFVLSWNEP